MRYRTIVADPPWDHSDGTGINFAHDRITAPPYPSMSLEQIKALPVKALSDNTDEDAHLYLWTTDRYLRDAYDVMRAWGFHPSRTIVWCKAERGFSLGGTWPSNVEFVLFGRRPKVVTRADVLPVTTYLADAAVAAGVTRRDVDRFMGTADMAGWWLSRIEYRCACPTNEQWARLKGLLHLDDSMDDEVARLNAAKGCGPSRKLSRASGSWFAWPRGEHSAKPEAFMDTVEQVSPAPRLEMFARRQRLGWDTWGNEALEHVEMGVSP